MHVRPQYSTSTPQRNGRHWWCLTWSLTAVLTLAVGTLPRAHAETFECDGGDVDCLIATINEANTNRQTNTIRLTAGVYTLTRADNETPDGATGLPVITSRLTIQGAGVDKTIIERDINASELFRLLQVAAPGALTLTRLTLRGGRALNGFGGGILNDGTLTLTHATLTNNFGEFGGGIANRGTAMLTNVTLATNTAGIGGGGIRNSGTLTVTYSTLIDNRGDHSGGISNSGILTLTHSTVAYNRSVTEGGGIRGGGLLTLTHTTLTHNTSGSFGGGIDNGGLLTLTHSTLTHNRAGGAPGGGIANRGTATLTNVTLAHNYGTTGAGILNSGTLTLTNTTLAYNMANIGGGGIANSTGAATMQNTLLALNTEDSFSSDCLGVITSLGTNLIGDTSGCTITQPPDGSDLEDIDDPGLGDLTDNGKPGNGHVPLLPGSPAIDTGNDAACPPRDQLGQRRVDIRDVGTSRCDIGAIEFQRRDQHQPDADLASATPGTP